MNPYKVLEQMETATPETTEVGQDIATSKRTVIYLRTAATDEAYTRLQYDACLRFCKQHHLMVVETLADISSGEEIADQPKLKELHLMMQMGYMDVVIVQSLGRLSRNPTELLAIVCEAEAHGVGIYSIFELVPGEDITPLRAEAMVQERERAAMLLAMADDRAHSNQDA